ncbi:MAG: response regulator transcription factor [Gemmatimonadaceae bacterium]
MTTRAPVTILSVDDHPLIREGLSALVATEPDMQVIGEAVDGEDAIERYRELRPDIVLMDLVMPTMDGLDAAKAILAEFPDAKIIMLTTYDGDEDIYRALALGAKGYLLKSMLRKDVLGVIRTVRDGGRGIPPAVASRLAEYTPRISLTPREVEILKLVAKGFSNPEVGRILGRSEGTIKVHVKNILQKLDATDRTEAVMIAQQRGFIRGD